MTATSKVRSEIDQVQPLHLNTLMKVWSCSKAASQRGGHRRALPSYVGIGMHSAKGAITGPSAPYLVSTMITGDKMIGAEAIIETAEW